MNSTYHEAIKETVQRYLSLYAAADLAQDLINLLPDPPKYAWYSPSVKPENDKQILVVNAFDLREHIVTFFDGKYFVVDRIGRKVGESPIHPKHVKQWRYFA